MTLDQRTEVDEAGAPLIRRVPHASLQHWFLLGTGAWLVLHATGLLGALTDATFVVIGVATIGAVVVGLRTYHVPDRRPWWLILGAFVVWIVGGGLRAQLDVLGDLSSERSLLPDAFSLSGYLLLLAGVGLLLRRHIKSREFRVDAALDASIVALASSAVAWATVLGPTVRNLQASHAVEVLLLTYPALSIIVVSLLCRLGFGAHMLRYTAYRTLIASMALLLVGDVVYMLVEVGQVHPGAEVRDLPYAAAFVTFGWGTLHPSVRELTRSTARWTPPSGRWRIMLVALALALPGLLAMFGGNDYGDRAVLGTITLLLAAAVVARITRALDAEASAHSRLAHVASHDAVTGLPNRAHLDAHLQGALYEAVNNGQVLGAILVDIDQFRLINDSLGHRVGDQLLEAVGQRLRAVVRASDFVSRLGADDFAIVYRAADAVAVREFAHAIRAAFATPFSVGTLEVRVSVNLGFNVVTGRSPSAAWSTLLEDAHSALSEAKRKSGEQIVEFHREMRSQVDRRLELEQQLRRAVDNGMIDVHYQPLVRLPDGTVKGFEALARWHHPTLGTISPAEFIPIAEDTGLVVQVGLHVLETALRQLAEWRSMGLAEGLQMSVNLSPSQLLDTHLRPIVPVTIDELGLSPADLQLEITEGLLVNDVGVATELLQQFRELGIAVALDDFGTGYSSLAHLKRFPVDVVKIDRSFVTHLGDQPRSSDESLVSAIVAMCGALGLATLAEGVETDEQADRLFELGVGAAQGFYYARPLPAAEVPEWLARSASAARPQPKR